MSSRTRTKPKQYWVDRNPILQQGEQAVEEETGYMKLGDGTTPWSELSSFMPVNKMTELLSSGGGGGGGGLSFASDDDVAANYAGFTWTTTVADGVLTREEVGVTGLTSMNYTNLGIGFLLNGATGLYQVRVEVVTTVDGTLAENETLSLGYNIDGGRYFSTVGRNEVLNHLVLWRNETDVSLSVNTMLSVSNQPDFMQTVSFSALPVLV